MTLTEITAILGNIGEFVGAVAVVLTLVYLAIQVRHGKESLDANTRALEEQQRLARAQTYQARADNARTQNLQLATSSDLSSIIATYHTQGIQALTPSEFLRFEAYQRALFLETDNLHYQAQHGFMRENFIEEVIIANIRFWGPVWGDLGFASARPEFQKLVEEHLSAGGLDTLNLRLKSKFDKLKSEGT